MCYWNVLLFFHFKTFLNSPARSIGVFALPNPCLPFTGYFENVFLLDMNIKIRAGLRPAQKGYYPSGLINISKSARISFSFATLFTSSG